MRQWFTFWFCLITLSVSAQQPAQNWFFGSNAGVSFLNGAPTLLSGGARVGYEAAATVSDAAGKLEFYTNSVDIWTRRHQPMLNGLNIGGHESAAQGAVIVRHPGNSRQYFIFVVDGCDNRLTGGLRFVTVDMTRQKGLGEVISRGNQLSTVPLTESVTAIRHANAQDYWVVVHGWETNNFYAYHVTATGIDATPVVTSIGPVHKGGSGAFGNANGVGFIKASPDGSKLAISKRDSNFELYDFDNATGQLSNRIALPQFYRSYGVEFSADGSKLYGSTLNGNQIYQFNLAAGNEAAIAASAVSIGTSVGYGYAGALQRGPDNKIYVALFNSHFLGVIDVPDALAAACSYRNEGVSLADNVSQLGLPNFPNAFPANRWTGAVSAAFSEAANWSKGMVPAATDDVLIPSGPARMPVLSINATVRNITVQTGASFTNDGQLTLLGNLVNQGTVVGTGTLVSASAGSHYIGGSQLSISSLTVGRGATLLLTGPVQVRRVLTLQGNLNTNGHPLTLLADEHGSALVVNEDGIATGPVTVQRYLGPTLKGTSLRQLIAAPVRRPTLASVATPAPTVSAAGLPAGAEAGPATPLESGMGYSIETAAPLLSFTGELHNGPYSISGPVRTATPQSGWWLVGNPYPSPLAWDKTLMGAAGLDAAVYAWQPSGPYAGHYASFVRGVSVNGGSNVIALGQAFFVHTTQVGTTGRLTFTNAARLTAPAVAPDAAETRALLRLALQSPAEITQVAVYFEAGATPAFDPAFDAYAPAARPGSQLVVPVGAAELAIQALPLLGAQARPVPLRLSVRAGRYTLRAAQLLNLPPGSDAYLLDAETGARINLREQRAYSFTVSGPARPNRFSLLFTARPALAAARPPAPQPWIALPEAMTRKGVVVHLYNTAGEVVQEYRLSPRATDALSLSLAGLLEGVYVVQVLSRLGTMNRRLRTRRTA
ncbi:hypothetical protein SAMN02745146_1692 [Hymenobacter daecheongensis DSM 21074]|uniref:Por secretion system C-terminal sorting domain-containing protein n=1 Tax=Hymenobacter daecheongensis DSM 21074 TaxID=1121955 RepID=A0A1M6EHX5_9BACT|nr:hypothetical protein [Hymenobacter daecheongensis]SHI84930.1 hypothetical protein SAMN02745146_1692 [Hymenobacter daecheongensis DSM 21074]